MHYNGMVQFLKRIGFLSEFGLWAKEDGGDRFNCQRAAPNLVRQANTAAFLGEPLREGGRDFYENLTGYDLVDFVRAWLRREGHDRLSVCEVVLIDRRFEDLRQYVGKANIFWSHLQMQDFVSKTTHAMKRIDLYDRCSSHRRFNAQNQCPPVDSEVLPRESMRMLWLDFFSLRQCQPDFDVNRIIELIGDIGMTVADIDMEGDYFKRSFCVFELYATVHAGCDLVCSMGRDCFHPAQMQCWPLKAQDATTRSPEDKQQIDRLIQDMDGGFRKLNRVVTESVFQSCPCPIHDVRRCPPDCQYACPYASPLRSKLKAACVLC